MILRIPPGASTIEMRASTIWFNDEGILYSLPKENAPPTVTTAEIREEMDRFRQIIGNRKVCIILESASKASTPSKEQRDLVAEEIKSVTKAMAMISSSPLSRMAANLFFSFKPPSYPFKIFSNEKDAREWIRQYL